MSGRHKFSELEAGMSPARRARINRLADEFGGQIDLAQSGKVAQAVLQLLQEHPDGLTNRQILEKLGLKGNKSGEQSISNVLSALTKSNKVSPRDRKYVSA